MRVSEIHTIIVGSKLTRLGLEHHRLSSGTNSRRNTSFNYSLCHHVQPLLIFHFVAFKDREIESISTVKLNIDKPWAVHTLTVRNIAVQIASEELTLRYSRQGRLFCPADLVVDKRFSNAVIQYLWPMISQSKLPGRLE